MLKLFREAFKITNEGIILAIPLALFWWILSLYLSFSTKVVDSLPEMVLSGITMLFMTSAFMAGWFYMVKKCINFSKKHFIFDRDKNDEALRLIKAIPRGVGRFFLFFIETCVIMVGIFLLVGSLISYFSLPYLQEITPILTNLGVNMYSYQEAQTFIYELSPDKTYELLGQLCVPLLKLSFVVVSIPTIVSFMLLLWIPEIIYTMKNPIIALFTSIHKTFKKFWKSLQLYIYIVVLQLIVSFLSPMMFKHPLLYILIIIIYFYLLVYIVVVIFTYYEEEFRNKRKKQQELPKA